MAEPPTPSRQLRDRGLAPRKRLGQNFLHDRVYLQRIVAAAQLESTDQVLEVGAGTGVLTAEIAPRVERLIAIELDDQLVRLLRDTYAGDPHVQIWHGNALEFDPCQHFDRTYKLVGNIPYYITGQILRHYLEAACPPSLLILLVQREVAERMTAAPGQLSLLGVSVQAYGQPRIVSRVPAGAFYPPPKVESAIVRIQPHPTPAFGSNPVPFFTVARAGFGTKRKQLANSLAHGLSISTMQARELLQMAGIEPSLRAEALTVADWARVADLWARREPAS